LTVRSTKENIVFRLVPGAFALFVILVGGVTAADAATTYLVDTRFAEYNQNGTGNYAPPGGPLSGSFTVDGSVGATSAAIVGADLATVFDNKYTGAPLFTRTYTRGDLLDFDGDVLRFRKSAGDKRWTLTLDFTGGNLLAEPATANFVPSERIQNVFVSWGFYGKQVTYGNFGYQGDGRTPSTATAAMTPVPLPAAAPLLIAAVAGLGAYRRFARR
jgi:hypothetical protein